MDQRVAMLRPVAAGGFVSKMMSHAHRPRREDGEIGAARALQLELRPLQALADLVVGDVEPSLGGDVFRIAQGRKLAFSIFRQFARSRGVVPVTIDDHFFPQRTSYRFMVIRNSIAPPKPAS